MGRGSKNWVESFILYCISRKSLARLMGKILRSNLFTIGISPSTEFDRIYNQACSIIGYMPQETSILKLEDEIPSNVK